MIANWAAWLGWVGGIGMGLLGWWWGRYQLKKNRGVDERYLIAWQKARAKSWISRW